MGDFFQQNEREILVEDIYRDEMRDGFLVTSHRKKLWNVQLNLIKEFARICDKHNLRWFVYAGTLLGAVRHKGFIPWDDDVDVVMFRPDYEKFKLIVEEELKNHPYYRMWYWFNYRLESDTTSTGAIDEKLPLISKEQEQAYPGWAPFHPLIRMLDTRTTFIMPDNRKNVFSNIWIDIMSIDPCPPFSTQETARNFEIARELLIATAFSGNVKKALRSNINFVISRNDMETFVNLPYKLRVLNFELFMLKNFFMSDYVCELKYYTIQSKNLAHKREKFDNVVYLPFEKIKVPAPIDYEGVLTDFYGDWRKPVIYPPHTVIHSANISYEEYCQKTGFE